MAPLIFAQENGPTLLDVSKILSVEKDVDLATEKEFISDGFDFIKLKPNKLKSQFIFKVNQGKHGKINFVELMGKKNKNVIYKFSFYYMKEGYVLLDVYSNGGGKGDTVFYTPTGELLIVKLEKQRLLSIDKGSKSFCMLDESLLPVSVIKNEEGEILNKHLFTYKNDTITDYKYSALHEIKVSRSTRITSLFDLLEGNDHFNLESKTSIRHTAMPYDLEHNVLFSNGR